MQNNQDKGNKDNSNKPMDKNNKKQRKEGSLVKLGELYDLRKMLKDKGINLKD